MGLFDKLKSLVSDDKKDTGTIEIHCSALWRDRQYRRRAGCRFCGKNRW